MEKLKLVLPLSGYALLVYLVLLAALYLSTPSREFDLPHILWLTHLMLLYIHEAGHLLFSFFGRTMTILGGSLNQLLAPTAWYIVAKREHSRLANVALVFTGVSLMDVSLYVKDAGMLVLPLIGGLSKSHHDWATLLNENGLIEYGAAMGESMYWTGIALALFGLYSGVRGLVQDNGVPEESNRSVFPRS